jgi:hypothetical protein
MKVRLASAVSVVLLAIVWAAPVRADCPPVQWAKNAWRDFKRNNCWPKPFDEPDRQTVRAPFAIMVQNGWRRQNLLGDYHFEMDTGKLTPAGEEKVRWILLEAPEQHRTIYVGRGRTAAETAARVDAVEKLIPHILPEGQPPAVLETNLKPHGWSADRVDAIGRKFDSSTPEPRLPTSAKGGESK